jgi:hypothetical protein
MSWSALGQEPLATTAKWRPEPSARGTWSIILTSIITLSLCIWTAVHLNLPENRSNESSSIACKLLWLFMGLFAPELVSPVIMKLIATGNRLIYVNLGFILCMTIQNTTKHPEKLIRVSRNTLQMWKEALEAEKMYDSMTKKYSDDKVEAAMEYRSIEFVKLKVSNYLAVSVTRAGTKFTILFLCGNRPVQSLSHARLEWAVSHQQRGSALEDLCPGPCFDTRCNSYRRTVFIRHIRHHRDSRRVQQHE